MICRAAEAADFGDCQEVTQVANLNWIVNHCT
jgi:hypothetical protein